MTITLSTETQKLLENRMKLNGISSPDDMLRAALMVMEQADAAEADRSPETMAAIREGLAQARAGQCRPWAEFKTEWMSRHSQD